MRLLCISQEYRVTKIITTRNNYIGVLPIHLIPRYIIHPIIGVAEEKRRKGGCLACYNPLAIHLVTALYNGKLAPSTLRNLPMVVKERKKRFKRNLTSLTRTYVDLSYVFISTQQFLNRLPSNNKTPNIRQLTIKDLLFSFPFIYLFLIKRVGGKD